MSQKFPINDFRWVEDLSKFNESIIKNHDENTDPRYFLEEDVEYPKILFNSHKYLSFLLKEKN